MSTFGTTTPGNPNPNNSFEVQCWEVARNGNALLSTPKASISHDKPVFCSAWEDDGTTVFSGGCDNQVKMWPLLSEVAWIPEMNLLVSGSWDKTLKKELFFFFTTKSSPYCYALTVKRPLMVVGTAGSNLITEFKRITSPLKYQTRCVAASPDQQGFLIGSIEGRVGVHHLDDSQESKNFTFKCHRDGSEIYSVNSLNFHPVHHTFATAGSDGAFNFWDKDSKHRPKAMSRCSQPIPCSAFNSDGSIYAYSICLISSFLHPFRIQFLVGYDWSKGAENHNPMDARNYIYLHLPQLCSRESEVKAKPGVGTSGRK
ncbi:hypothetical protein UlMin_033148 [Ulmus minor]